MKIKCPACGFTETIPIQYGDPTCEAHLKAQEGKLVLGSCEINEKSPSRYCPSCRGSFGSGIALTDPQLLQISYRYTNIHNYDRYYQLDFNPTRTAITLIEIVQKSCGRFKKVEFPVSLGFERYLDLILKMNDFYFLDWKNEKVLSDEPSWGLEVFWNDEIRPTRKEGKGLPPYHVKMTRLFGRIREMGKIY